MPYLPFQLVNHYENHSELTNKQSLYTNLLNYCKENQKNIRDLMPQTFVIDFESKNFHSQVKLFACSLNFLGKKQDKFWIFKPCESKKAKKCFLFNRLADFKVHLKKAYHKKSECKSVIVQKYLDNPLLLKNNKFNVRI